MAFVEETKAPYLHDKASGAVLSKLKQYQLLTSFACQGDLSQILGHTKSSANDAGNFFKSMITETLKDLKTFVCGFQESHSTS